MSAMRAATFMASEEVEEKEKGGSSKSGGEPVEERKILDGNAERRRRRHCQVEVAAHLGRLISRARALSPQLKIRFEALYRQDRAIGEKKGGGSK